VAERPTNKPISLVDGITFFFLVVATIVAFDWFLKKKDSESLVALLGLVALSIPAIPFVIAVFKRSRRDYYTVILLFMNVLVIGGYLAIINPPITSEFSFEDAGKTMGWKCQDIPKDKPDFDTQACEDVSQSYEQHIEGSGSLKITMKLIGNNETHSKGEAWVELSDYLDLTDRPVSIWVYAPEGSQGNPDIKGERNGFQVFVKDADWDSEYGCWFNAPYDEGAAGSSATISLTVTADDQDCLGWYKDRNFDPTRIRAIGIKMGAGGDWDGTYDGPIYIDAVEYRS
jgi:hypothetical protein